MKTADGATERYLRQATLHTLPGMDKVVFDRIMAARQAGLKDRQTSSSPVLWRCIAASRITRLAIAAGLILGVLIAIGRWGGSIDGSSTAWARVVQKVRAMESYTYRQRQIETTGPRPDGFEFTSDVEYVYHCSKRYGWYIQMFRNGQPFGQCYALFQTRQWVTLGQSSAVVDQKSMTDADLKEMEDKQPQAIAMRILSCNPVEIGHSTIDGIDVIGVETHHPAAGSLDPSPPIRDVTARLWIDPQTDLPVWMEISYAHEGSDTRTTIVADRFQWNVDLDPKLFEPNVPAGSLPVQGETETRPATRPQEQAMQDDPGRAPYLRDFDHLQRPKVDGIVLLGIVPSSTPRTAVRMQDFNQIWKAQDEAMGTWPGYAQVRDRLYSELKDKLHVDQISAADLVALGIALRDRFWAVGGELSEASYPYGYAARLVCEIAHERQPEDLAVTDQLVESLLTMEMAYHYTPDSDKTSRSPLYPGLLLDLRSQQFRQIQARASTDPTMAWKDFVRVLDLAELLGYAKDFASATQAYEWLISETDRIGWTAYGRMLKAGLKACGEGHPFICDIYPAGVAFPEEFRYTNVRRLPSFQGPEIRRRRLLPLHLWDPKDISSSGNY